MDAFILIWPFIVLGIIFGYVKLSKWWFDDRLLIGELTTEYSSFDYVSNKRNDVNVRVLFMTTRSGKRSIKALTEEDISYESLMDAAMERRYFSWLHLRGPLPDEVVKK